MSAAVPNVHGVRIASMPQRYAVGLAVAAFAAFAALLWMYPAPVGTPVKSAEADQLVLTWVDGGDQLQIDGAGYRFKAMVEIRLGSDPIVSARADELGRVRLSVPRRLIAAGQPGASIIVAGRSKFGTSRALYSAVPPRAAGRGPIDVLPWAVGAVVLARLGVGVFRRRRRAATADRRL